MTVNYDVRQIVYQHNSDAEMQVWVTAIHAQMVAIGLTNTSDTGQVDTATVTRPGTNTATAFKVYRFNDAAQATEPIFFKLYFGTGSATTRPGLKIEVGTGSDGAGNLTGSIFTSTVQSFSGTTTAVDGEAVWDDELGLFWARWVAYFGSGSYVSAILSRSCDINGDIQEGTFLVSFEDAAAGTRIYQFSTGLYTLPSLFALPASPPGASDPRQQLGSRAILHACNGWSPNGDYCVYPGMMGHHGKHFFAFEDVQATPFATAYTYSPGHDGSSYGFDADANTYGKVMLRNA